MMVKYIKIRTNEERAEVLEQYPPRNRQSDPRCPNRDADNGDRCSRAVDHEGMHVAYGFSPGPLAVTRWVN